MKKQLQKIFIALAFFAGIHQLAAQDTAFNYQGRLNDGGAPASGIYDLRFAIYDAATNGNQIGASLTNFATSVTGGLFSVTLDFGGIFTGTNYWLGMGVQTNGGNSFTALAPRQPITPAPYAIFANIASNLLNTNLVGKFSGNFSGNGDDITNINPANIASGQNTQQQWFSNPNNAFNGYFAGNFSGNGGNLTNISASVITGGLTTNIAVSVPGGTKTLFFTNGVLRTVQ